MSHALHHLSAWLTSAFDLIRMRHVFNNRIVQRTVGMVLICLAAIATCVWFFWLVPLVQRYDPLWQEQFTRKAYWKEVRV